MKTGGYRGHLYNLLIGTGLIFDFIGTKNSNHDDDNLGFIFPERYWDHEGYNSATITGTTGVFNSLGQVVATLVDGKQDPGFRSIEWDASAFAGGVYFYNLTVGSFKETRGMVSMR